MLETEIQENSLSKKKKKNKWGKIKKLKNKNSDLRKEKSEKENELKELLKTNERMENIYASVDLSVFVTSLI